MQCVYITGKVHSQRRYRDTAEIRKLLKELNKIKDFRNIQPTKKKKKNPAPQKDTNMKQQFSRYSTSSKK